jgi:hypothetical protein
MELAAAGKTAAEVFAAGRVGEGGDMIRAVAIAATVVVACSETY